MITETRQSRTHLLQYEYHRHKRHRRRHHTLDNSTLDKFKFICIPLNIDESRIDSSSSYTNLNMTQPKQFTTSTTTILPSPTTLSTASRRVRFKFDDNDKNQTKLDMNNNRHTRSSDDVRLSEKNSIHRVEFEIPIHRDTNPWLNIDASSPAKTRSLTSKKIEIKHSPNISMRVQNIAPYIEAEIASQMPTATDYEKSQSQWYRQLYSQLHKPFDMKKDHSENPYKPTYTFPDEFNGDPDHMEDYIRKKATQTIDQNDQPTSSTTIRIPVSSLKDPRTSSKRTNSYVEKVIRFDDSCSSPAVSFSNEQIKSNTDGSTGISSSSSSINNNLRSSTNDSSPSDNEQKLLYKRIMRGGEIPINGLQKFSNNNRGR